MRTKLAPVWLATLGLFAAACEPQLSCIYKEGDYNLTIGEPHTGPVVPMGDLPSCGPLGDTNPGQVYRFVVTRISHRLPSCFADGQLTGATLDRPAIRWLNPLLNTREDAPLYAMDVTLPSGCRGNWTADVGIDAGGIDDGGVGAVYFARAFSPLTDCPPFPAGTGARPVCADFFTATLTPR